MVLILMKPVNMDRFCCRSLSVRICGGLATGRASRGRICQRPEPEWFGRSRNPARIRRNPEESRGIRWKYRNSCPTRIPAKKSCKSDLKQDFQDPPKPHSCEQVPLKKKPKKRNLQESCSFSVFQYKK
jgi:hypothetical protein